MADGIAFFGLALCIGALLWRCQRPPEGSLANRAKPIAVLVIGIALTVFGCMQ